MIKFKCTNNVTLDLIKMLQFYLPLYNMYCSVFLYEILLEINNFSSARRIFVIFMSSHRILVLEREVEVSSQVIAFPHLTPGVQRVHCYNEDLQLKPLVNVCVCGFPLLWSSFLKWKPSLEEYKSRSSYRKYSTLPSHCTCVARRLPMNFSTRVKK